jgi:putative ABC transport system permease protein
MSWLPPWTQRKKQEEQLDKELRFHTQERVADLVRSGLSGEEARRRVRLEFGGVEQVKEDCRDARALQWMGHIVQDLRFTLRMIGKNRVFSLAVVFILALGIGANTAVFSIVDAVLLKPSLFPAPHSLVRIEENMPQRTLSGVPAKHFQTWAGRLDIFEHLAPFIRDTVTLTGGADPEQVVAVRAKRLFPALGIAARLGRTLNASDEEAGAPKAAVLSDRLWRRRFQSDPSVIGRPLTISGEVYVIAGVMPPDFEFRYPEAELWTPLHMATTTPWLQVAARLRPGVSASDAASAMEIAARRMEAEEPKEYAGLKFSVKTWRDTPDEKYKSTILFVLVAAGLIMLIVCANVGSLLLSRAVQRQKELTIRASLGAGISRIVRQLLCESLVLAVLGSLAGIVLAQFALEILSKQLAALPVAVPNLQRLAVDGRVLGFSVALCLAASVLCSLAPILLAARSDLQAALRGGQAASTPGGSGRMFSALIALQAGFAFLLLAGSGLMIRSLVNLQQEDHGFRPHHVLTLRVPVGTLMQPRPSGNYDTRPRQMAYYREILERVKPLPGIQAAAIVNNLPLSGIHTSLNFNISGPGGKSAPTSARTISPQYFAAMGIPLIAGRDFAESDQAGAPAVAIINESLARQLFAGRNPIGDRLPGESKDPGALIVGVVKDSSQTSYEAPVGAEVYIPYQQFLFATFMSTLVVRTEGEPTSLAATLRKTIWSVDPNQPVVQVQTMEEVIDRSIWRPRFSAWIFSVLGGLSLMLTAVGVYGIVANTSAMRAREVGIRVALGATSGSVLVLILRGALLPLVGGLAVSTVAALALSRFLASLLYRVSGNDPVTYLTAAGLLIAIGAAASAAPAWRAAIGDPLPTLRAE